MVMAAAITARFAVSGLGVMLTPEAELELAVRMVKRQVNWRFLTPHGHQFLAKGNLSIAVNLNAHLVAVLAVHDA